MKKKNIEIKKLRESLSKDLENEEKLNVLGIPKDFLSKNKGTTSKKKVKINNKQDIARPTKTESEKSINEMVKLLQDGEKKGRREYQRKDVIAKNDRIIKVMAIIKKEIKEQKKLGNKNKVRELENNHNYLLNYLDKPRLI